MRCFCILVITTVILASLLSANFMMLSALFQFAWDALISTFPKMPDVVELKNSLPYLLVLKIITVSNRLLWQAVLARKIDFVSWTGWSNFIFSQFLALFIETVVRIFSVSYQIFRQVWQIPHFFEVCKYCFDPYTCFFCCFQSANIISLF